MTHALSLKLRATTAICAVLALGSTPALAQEVAPTIDPPAAPTQQPTLQLPSDPPATPPAVVSRPVVQPPPAAASVEAAPAPAAAAPRAAAERREAARPAARTAASSATAPAVPARAAVPVPSSAESPAASVPLAPPAVPPPPAIDAPRAGADAPAEAGMADGEAILPGAIAALLLALGIGGGAWFAARARRRRTIETHDGSYQTLPEQAVAREPEAPLPAFATVEDIAGRPVVHAAPQEEPRMFALPDDAVPQTREERDALLDRMVSAPPDAENPFTSRKGRMRRARRILQARELAQKEATPQPFDWRTYESSTSDPAPATPPRVTA